MQSTMRVQLTALVKVVQTLGVSELPVSLGWRKVGRHWHWHQFALPWLDDRCPIVT